MTIFLIVAAAMVAAALLWLLLPLLRKRGEEQAEPHSGRTISALAVAILVPALAALMYASLSNWNWEAAQADAARAEQFDDLLKQLEARLQSNPDDLNGWLLLGRSYVSMQRFAEGVNAYERAYELSRGENVDAILGLGEALVMVDESSLTGRASALFDAALAKAPNHPKALWYGSMAALQSGDLRKGRDRLQSLLAQGPPDELRNVLERQIQDINAQIGEAGQTGETAQRAATGEGAPAAARSIQVAVSIAPEIQQQLKEPLALFVLAREPAGGPPLAVKRLSSSELPLTVELSERDAMMPTRTIGTVSRVQVVARLSRTGTAQAQSGDYFGQADYEFGKDTGTLNIRIDQTVP